MYVFFPTHPAFFVITFYKSYSPSKPFKIITCVFFFSNSLATATQGPQLVKWFNVVAKPKISSFHISYFSIKWPFTVVNLLLGFGIASNRCLCSQGLTPYEFVESMKKKGIRVPGIGHR